MCLIDYKRCVTEDNVTCYKIYIKDGTKTYSPFGKQSMPNYGEESVVKYPNLQGGEGIHVFLDKTGVSRLINIFSYKILGMTKSRKKIDLVVNKCFIPKDTKCIVGLDSSTKSKAACCEKIVTVSEQLIVNSENIWTL